MAKMYFAPAHNFRFGYSEFENYKITGFDTGKGVMTLKYNAAVAGSFDAGRSPWVIKVKINNATSYKAEDGKYEGQDVLTGGKVASIKWYGKGGGPLQVTMNDISMDAGEFQYMVRENPARLYENLVAGDSEFYGPKANANGSSISTGSGDDIVNVRGGGSYIDDNGGSDEYIGSRSKWDILSYSGWTYDRRPGDKGIEADLAAGTVNGPDGEIDTIQAIDQIIATNKKDVLIGNEFSNSFAGLRGADVIEGGVGFDRAIYTRDASFGGYDGIRANLTKGTIRDGFGTVDKVKSIENVDGTNSRDVFIGNNSNNKFRGGDANDKFVFNGTKFGTDTILDYDASEGDKLQIRKANKFGDLKISKSNGDTIVELNKDSKIVLDNYTGSLDAGDFIF